MIIFLWIILGIIGAVLLWSIAMYNQFIKLRTRAEEAWADIDVQLKRRYDLIPNLVETVKGYATHERETLDRVIEARNMAMQADMNGNTAEALEAENMLSGTLKSLFALSESYPDLKANTNFLELQRELSDTENKIQAARRFYNTSVRDFNIKTRMFPSNIIANMFGFDEHTFYDLDDSPEQRETVKVDFN